MEELHDEEPTGAEQVADSPRERRLELVVTILLSAAALLSAWSAYQSASYSSKENAGHATATRLQVDATRADNQAGLLGQIDLVGFYEWVDATTSGDATRATFLRERFREEMKPAFEAWVELDPLDDPDAPATPFLLPEYRLESALEASELQSAAEAAERRAESAGSVSDKYLLAVVLFAAALFQLGIQSRIGVFELRRALVIVSGCIVVGTAIWMLTLA